MAKTAYERCRGKRSTVMAIEFGEKLLWKVRQKNKLESSTRDGSMEYSWA